MLTGTLSGSAGLGFIGGSVANSVDASGANLTGTGGLGFGLGASLTLDLSLTKATDALGAFINGLLLQSQMQNQRQQGCK